MYFCVHECTRASTHIHIHTHVGNTKSKLSNTVDFIIMLGSPGNICGGLEKDVIVVSDVRAPRWCFKASIVVPVYVCSLGCCILSFYPAFIVL